MVTVVPVDPVSVHDTVDLTDALSPLRRSYLAPWERTWCQLPPEVPALDLAPPFTQSIRRRQKHTGMTSALVSAGMGAVVTAVLMTATGAETGMVDPTSGSTATGIRGTPSWIAASVRR